MTTFNITTADISEAIPAAPGRKLYLPVMFAVGLEAIKNQLAIDHPFELSPEDILEQALRQGFEPDPSAAVERPHYGLSDTVSALRFDGDLYLVTTNTHLGYIGIEEVRPYTFDER